MLTSRNVYFCESKRRRDISLFTNDASHWKCCRLQFRVALLLKLSQHNPEPIVSAPVVITTLAAGLPTSPPRIVRGSAVDSYRVSVSWEPGEFVNGPLLSYVLRLQGDNHTQLKVYATPEPFIQVSFSLSLIHTLRVYTHEHFSFSFRACTLAADIFAHSQDASASSRFAVSI